MLGIVVGPSRLMVDIDALNIGWRRGIGRDRYFDHEGREVRLVVVNYGGDIERLVGLQRGTVIWEHPRLLPVLLNMPAVTYAAYQNIAMRCDVRAMPT